MKVNRADIVLIDYPSATGAGSKVRPALIVQADVRNHILDHTIAAMISSSTAHATTDPTQLLIDRATPEGSASGLRKTSVVKCGNLYTIHEKLVRIKFGGLSPQLMNAIDDCLRAALEIS